jgi:hypothetical protein
VRGKKRGNIVEAEVVRKKIKSGKQRQLKHDNRALRFDGTEV